MPQNSMTSFMELRLEAKAGNLVVLVTPISVIIMWQNGAKF